MKSYRLQPGNKINLKEFDPQRLFMLSIYLLVMGLLLGYLAEQQKHLRAEKAVITGILSRVRVEAGLTGTIEQIFNVKVDKVHTLNRQGKTRRTRFGIGKRKDTKRAIVSLREGSIDIFGAGA